MFVQIEITTVCNFRCFYCIGRTWHPRHMGMELFESILARLSPGKHTVSLQGEGEPLAHPGFWTMVDLVRSRGCDPYLITNGSHPRTPALADHVPLIGVSLDTLDPIEANRIGRLRLDRVLANLDALVGRAGPDRVVVHTVDYGQDRKALEEYLLERGIKRHVVQPLQRKEDYRRRYAEKASPAPPVSFPVTCSHLQESRMRYFNIDGIAMPCPYIKDVLRYESEAKLRADFAAGRVPAACSGCREIRRRPLQRPSPGDGTPNHIPLASTAVPGHN